MPFYQNAIHPLRDKARGLGGGTKLERGPTSRFSARSTSGSHRQLPFQRAVSTVKELANHVFRQLFVRKWNASARVQLLREVLYRNGHVILHKIESGKPSALRT